MNEFNKNRRPNGYWESYYQYPNEKKMFFKGNYNNGNKINGWVYFKRNGDIRKKEFHL